MSFRRFLFIFIFLLLIGCGGERYTDFVKTSQSFMTDVTNEVIFDKCFVAWTIQSYRERGNGHINVRVDGKIILDKTTHSISVIYKFIDRNNFTITDFIIDGESEPEVLFMYYMTQLFNDNP